MTKKQAKAKSDYRKGYRNGNKLRAAFFGGGRFGSRTIDFWRGYKAGRKKAFLNIWGPLTPKRQLKDIERRIDAEPIILARSYKGRRETMRV